MGHETTQLQVAIVAAETGDIHLIAQLEIDTPIDALRQVEWRDGDFSDDIRAARCHAASDRCAVDLIALEATIDDFLRGQ